MRRWRSTARSEVADVLLLMFAAGLLCGVLIAPSIYLQGREKHAEVAKVGREIARVMQRRH
jgi:uncharacterized membrane protein YciS (DUF1049 family)